MYKIISLEIYLKNFSANLLFTETDNLVYKIGTEDVYED